jgi:hypothetical protein
MRFKLYYNEQTEQMDFNCLKDKFTDVILPDDPNQHVYFPIPDELQNEIREELLSLVTAQDSEDMQLISEQMKALTSKRKELVNNLRVKLNPKIIEKCKEFKEDNAEYFI